MTAPDPSPRSSSGLALVVACGLLATAWRYHFLEADTLELLAPIMRAADPQFLPYDFYTWTGSVFGPHTAFVTLFGMLARVVAFDRLYLVTTALANVGLALVSYASARRLFPASSWAPRVAVALVCCAPIPAIGGPSTCFATSLTPETLAFPLLAAALHFGLLAADSTSPWRRGLYAGIPATLALLLAPRLGLPGAALLLAALLARGPRSQASRASALVFALLLPSIILVAAPLVVHSRALADETFVAIAVQHDPERYSPSHVFASWRAWAGVGAVLGLTLISAIGWASRETTRARPIARAYFALLALLLVSLLASEVFIEHWPWRAWLLFTPMRCFSLLAWIALVLAAGEISQRALTRDKSVWPPVCAVLVTLALATTTGPMALAILALSLACFTLTAASARPPLFALALALCVGALALNQRARSETLGPELRAWLDAYFHPRWHSTDYNDDAMMLARDVARYTPPTGVILTPPAFGSFRLIAQRALVVDFDGLPQHDLGIAEWGARMFDCYGPPKGPGRASLPDYEQRYARLSDAELAVIGARYHANFAVVAAERGKSLRVLFEHGDYALVVLSTPPDTQVRRSR